MSRYPDPEREAVETLARLAGTPSPPPGLRIGIDSHRKRRLRGATALALLLAGVTGLMIWRRSSIPDRRPVPPFVVEHIRVQGRSVQPRVLEVPGSGALVLMLSSHGGRKSGVRSMNHPPAAVVFDGAVGGRQ